MPLLGVGVGRDVVMLVDGDDVGGIVGDMKGPGVVSLLLGTDVMRDVLSPVTKLIDAIENAIIKKRESTSMFFL